MIFVGFTGNPTPTSSGQSACRLRSLNLCRRRPRTRQGAPGLRCAAANPNEMLSTEQLDEWRKVSEFVRTVNSSLGAADADKLVGRAFGWGTQKFWRGDVRHEAPSLQQAEDSVSFLRDKIGLDDDGLGDVVKKFPEVLRLRLERMNENVEKIQSNYPNIKGNLLTNSIRATPAVLGYDFDCEGDCKSGTNTLVTELGYPSLFNCTKYIANQKPPLDSTEKNAQDAGYSFDPVAVREMQIRL